ncbi:diguanylate cyclase (GGDEF)-like protein [Pseudorhizobium tarimense]|uniref:Diguanylate cyclase (GGDEF)-like protein n=1 Tax=Pseudorhizobium tarimense TaxID=1079109 RepID=A0ABV2H8Q9_9HYPH|nr:EAL domain-containing protein [Pseudorhizobium tarimense]MCJ8520058.1 EAL domain-containing protein [Pseudorhizobium tarimense]
MNEFSKSRAGKQFVLAVSAAVLVWAAAFRFREELSSAAGALSGDRADTVIVTLAIAGIASFIYSILRIADLRYEMVRRGEAEQRADYIATHDHLTKLPNRYAFDRFQLTPLTDKESDEVLQPSATVYSIDLDGFKKVNDLLGHQGGDALLKEVARRICALSERGSVFRFGGDEFIAVMRNLTPQQEERFAALLIQSITRPVHIGDMTAGVGASVGYARFPEQGVELGVVSHLSDIALYEAKARGPNHHVLFTPQMQQKVSERAKVEGELREAIETDQIKPFYQPLIDLRTGDVCGFEALARWVRTDGSKVPPAFFIPVAEEKGLITSLFQRVLHRACCDAMQWHKGILLSFNVSPVQMEDRLLPARIFEILGKTGLSPDRLEIEITENALVADPDLAAKMMEELHAAGIKVALDDFGTGYSSLSQLARFKFDKIKIDKSFVGRCGSDDRQAKIIQAMLGLSRNLNAKTTVEGLEDHQQVAYFIQQGCDIGQGYVFGRPASAEDTLEYLAQRRRVLATA